MNIMIQGGRAKKKKAFGRFAKRQMLIKEAVGPSCFGGRLSPFVIEKGEEPV